MKELTFLKELMLIILINNDNEDKSLHIMLPKINAYVKRYGGQTKWMYYMIEDNDLLKK